MSALGNALYARQAQYTAALQRLRELADDTDTSVEVREQVALLREAIELVGCLRRLVGSAELPELHRAFGAPGDFGYGTPIGDALIKLYRGES